MSRQKTEDGLQRRRELLGYIDDYAKEHRYMPTVSEMARGMDLSRASIRWHLTSLRSQGFVKFDPQNISRTLKLSTRRDRATME